ncbi:hypothetical protein ACN28I_24925 [Archangium gephyra]|uniref:hypothetical protein n=1 Tax=Archangium gephyra TaxID=48 RepID=UPI003B7C1CAB
MSHTNPSRRGGTKRAGYMRLSAVATFLFASAALAQPTGLPAFELERLELNPNGRGSLLMGTGELLPKGGFRLSLAGQYENDPLVMYRNGNRLGSVVGDRVTAHLLAAWAPMHWLELGVQLPLVAWQRGDDLSAQGVAAPASTGLSTPTAHVRLGLLAQRREAPVDLALELGVGLPVGSVDTLSRDSIVRLSPKVMVGRSFGALRAGVEAGALIRPAVVLGDAGEVQDELGNEVRLGAVLATTGEGLRGEPTCAAACRSPASRAPWRCWRACGCPWASRSRPTRSVAPASGMRRARPPSACCSAWRWAGASGWTPRAAMTTAMA